MLNQSCPRCNHHIPHDRYVSGRAFCDCGWSTAPAYNPTGIGNFNEISLGYTPAQAYAEAARCLRCDVRTTVKTEEE